MKRKSLIQLAFVVTTLLVIVDSDPIEPSTATRLMEFVAMFAIISICLISVDWMMRRIIRKKVEN